MLWRISCVGSPSVRPVSCAQQEKEAATRFGGWVLVFSTLGSLLWVNLNLSCFMWDVYGVRYVALPGSYTEQTFLPDSLQDWFTVPQSGANMCVCVCTCGFECVCVTVSICIAFSYNKGIWKTITCDFFLFLLYVTVLILRLMKRIRPKHMKRRQLEVFFLH